MGTLFNIAGWVIAIVVLGLGVISLIGMFIDSSGWVKFLGVVAIALGIFVFTRVYAWSDSIGISLFATGFVLAVFGVGTSGHSSEAGGSSHKSEKEYTLGQAAMDTICEYEFTKAAVKDAIRESKE